MTKSSELSRRQLMTGAALAGPAMVAGKVAGLVLGR